jgi:hypothetical protein
LCQSDFCFCVKLLLTLPVFLPRNDQQTWLLKKVSGALVPYWVTRLSEFSPNWQLFTFGYFIYFGNMYQKMGYFMDYVFILTHKIGWVT